MNSKNTDEEKATVRQKAPKHNWHLDANGVEVTKGQGEGVSEAETEREPSASKADLIAHIDFLTRKRAQESQRYAKLWEERHDLKAHADKLAEALKGTLAMYKACRPKNLRIVALVDNAEAAVAAYEEVKQ